VAECCNMARVILTDRGGGVAFSLPLDPPMVFQGPIDRKIYLSIIFINTLISSWIITEKKVIMAVNAITLV
jgi:hypothetical protein